MATNTSNHFNRPARDEWGVYDPQQAGIAALVARLDAREIKAAAAAEIPAVKAEPESAETAPPARPPFGDAQ